MLVWALALVACADPGDGQCSDVVPLVGPIAPTEPRRDNNCPRGAPVFSACDYAVSAGPTDNAPGGRAGAPVLQVQGSREDENFTVLWTGCRDARVSVTEQKSSILIKVTPTEGCTDFATWGRTIELASQVGERVVRDRTPAYCD